MDNYDYIAPSSDYSDITDSKSNILELQRNLYDIAFFDRRIPRIVPNGIYDTQTKNAVREFQSLNELNSDGVVSYETWNKIIEVNKTYKDKYATPLYVYIFPSFDYVIENGESGDLIIIIQYLLKAINEHFSIVDEIIISGIYDETTIYVVTELQKIHNLEPNGKIDKKTWNIIAMDYNKYANQKT